MHCSIKIQKKFRDPRLVPVSCFRLLAEPQPRSLRVALHYLCTIDVGHAARLQDFLQEFSNYLGNAVQFGAVEPRRIEPEPYRRTRCSPEELLFTLSRRDEWDLQM